MERGCMHECVSRPFPRLRRFLTRLESDSTRRSRDFSNDRFCLERVPKSVDVLSRGEQWKKGEGERGEYWRSSSCRAIEQHLPGSHDCLAIAVPTCFEHATQFVCVSLFHRAILLSSLKIVQSRREGVESRRHVITRLFNDRVSPLQLGFSVQHVLGYLTLIRLLSCKFAFRSKRFQNFYI